MVWLARSWCCRSKVHFEFCVCKGQWFWPLQIWFSCATGNQKTQWFGQDMPRNVILLCDLNPCQGQRQLLCIARVLWFKMNAKQFVNRWFVKQKCHVEGMHVLMCWNMHAQQRSRGQKKTFVFQMAQNTECWICCCLQFVLQLLKLHSVHCFRSVFESKCVFCLCFVCFDFLHVE